MKTLKSKVIIFAAPLLSMAVLSMAGCAAYDHHYQGQRWYNGNYYHRNEGYKGDWNYYHRNEGNKGDWNYYHRNKGNKKNWDFNHHKKGNKRNGNSDHHKKGNKVCMANC
jgi:hypothetical protein